MAIDHAKPFISCVPSGVLETIMDALDESVGQELFSVFLALEAETAGKPVSTTDIATSIVLVEQACKRELKQRIERPNLSLMERAKQAIESLRGSKKLH